MLQFLSKKVHFCAKILQKFVYYNENMVNSVTILRAHRKKIDFSKRALKIF
jgi:hypothetical protein